MLEFGLRRAQGVDGALAASRAAYLGGCAATSNVLAGRRFGIPVAGTHAHSWVMSYDDEPAAFAAYAEAMPNNCVFLVDTYDTLDGVRAAIEVGRRLRARGHEMVGIRLDSGDLAWLSIEARRMLDAAGFPDAAVMASNDLDEHLIASIKEQGATIAVWGVGTKLVTGYDQPALGGVYKLSAVRRPGTAWQPRLKLSEQVAKVTTPGVLEVRRYTGADGHDCDLIWDAHAGIDADPCLVDPLDPTRRRRPRAGTVGRDLLTPVLAAGEPVAEPPSLASARDHARAELDRLPAESRRLHHPHAYPVGLERGLHARKMRMIEAERARHDLGDAHHEERTDFP